MAHILLLEADDALAERLQGLLSGCGLPHPRLKRVHHPQSALAWLAGRNTDLIVADLRLPNGFNVPLAGHLLEAAPGAAFVALGECTGEEHLRLLEVGVGERLTPAELAPETFHRAVHQALARAVARREPAQAGRDGDHAVTPIAEIIRHIMDGIVIVDRNGTVRFANPAAEELFGLDQGRLIGQPYGYSLETGAVMEQEFRRPDGRRSLAEVCVSKIAWGEDPALVVSMRDVTRRRQTERDLRVLDWAVRQALNPIVFCNLEGRLQRVNPAFRKLWGFGEREPLQGRYFADLFVTPANARDLLHQALRADSGPGELAAKTADGRVFHVRVDVSTVHDEQQSPLCLMASVLDITEQKAAERKLRTEAATTAAQLHFERALDMADSTGAIANCAQQVVPRIVPEGRAVIWLYDETHDHLAPLSGGAGSTEPPVPPEPIAGLELARLRQSFGAERRLVVVNLSASPASNLRGLGGELLFLPLSSAGQFLGALGVVHAPTGGVSERQSDLLASIAHRLSLALYAQRQQDDWQRTIRRLRLLNRINRAIGERHDLADLYGTCLRLLEDGFAVDFAAFLEQAMDQPSGFAVAAVGPESCRRDGAVAFRPGRTFANDDPLLASVLRGAEVVGHVLKGAGAGKLARALLGAGLPNAIVSGLRVEGQTGAILLLGRAAGPFNAEEREFVGQIVDQLALALRQTRLYLELADSYNELRRTEAAVLKQERLRALGEMAAGIAHDINNSLTPIRGYASLLLEREAQLSDRGRRQLELVNTASSDIAAIVARMREFYRQRDANETPTPVDLNHLLGEVIELTRPRWRDMAQERDREVRIEKHLAPELPPIAGIESELREVFANLVYNALDALTDGGSLCFRTFQQDNRIVVELADDGCGMDEETLSHCFEPFFTTKGQDGTGLGLAVVFGAMKRHEGEAKIHSVPGEGTTVRLEFPCPTGTGLAPEPVTCGAPVSALDSPLRVLCVDDEPMIGELLHELLTGEGHRVSVANGGSAALSLFRQALAAGDPFDAVITDLGMPGVGGREVAREIKLARPETPVILLTGWGTRLAAEGDLSSDIDVVLSKPPKLTAVLEALARVAAPA